jgi:uncharacterized membrane protein
LFSGGVLLFAALMLSFIVQYFPYQHGMLFLSTKSEFVLNKAWYIAAFYVHISTSIFSIALGAFQFMPFLIKEYPKWHQRIGKVYIYSILFLAAPSGFIIALFANGGFPSKLGFVCLSVIWWLSTFRALRFAMKRQWLQHITWAMRGYAITLAALSLRVEGYGLHYLFNTKPIETYVALSWFSWVGNLFVIEILLYLSIHIRLYQLIFSKKNSTK